jgi:hypothetical protein
MVDAWNIHVPFVVGAVAVVLGIVTLATGHRMLRDADNRMVGEEEIAGEVADEFGGAPGAIDDEVRAGHGRSSTPARS